jgi:hypothetical protein
MTGIRQLVTVSVWNGPHTVQHRTIGKTDWGQHWQSRQSQWHTARDLMLHQATADLGSAEP